MRASKTTLRRRDPFLEAVRLRSLRESYWLLYCLDLFTVYERHAIMACVPSNVLQYLRHAPEERTDVLASHRKSDGYYLEVLEYLTITQIAALNT